MTTHQWLHTATQFLQSKSITTARLDCLILLEDTLKIDRARLLAEPNLEMKDGAVAALQKLLSRRSRHEPLAYIRGHAEFYGRRFAVSPAVLVPRPESETIIELLKALPDLPTNPSIADVGCGSGCLGITAGLELPNSHVTLIDVDEPALKIAELNVVRHATGISCVRSNLLSDTNESFDVLLCNLPYVPDEFEINRAAKHEPAIALFAGSDGLVLYRDLFKQLANRTEKPLYLLCESFPDQHSVITELAVDAGYKLSQSEDFVQVFRLATA